MPVSEVRALVETAFDRPRLRFEWHAADPKGVTAADLPPVAARIVLCLTLIASEALPRGGTIRIKTAGGLVGSGLAVEAEGPTARLAPEALQALQAADCRDLTSSTVVGYYVQMLADRFAATVVTDVDDGRVRLSLSDARPGRVGGGRRRH